MREYVLYNIFVFILIDFIVIFVHVNRYFQVIACLDVRANDQGDLVVTKGDQYDVRENTDENEVFFYNLLLKLKIVDA